MTTSKTCTACHGTFDISAFATKGPARLQPKCRSCVRLYNQAHYQATASTRRPQLHQRKREEQARLQALVVAARTGQSCAKCNSTTSLVAQNTPGGLSRLVRSQRRAELIAAIEGCTWMCSRCFGATVGKNGAGISHVKGAPMLDDAILTAVMAGNSTVSDILDAVVVVRPTATKAGVRQRLSALVANNHISRPSRGVYNV